MKKSGIIFFIFFLAISVSCIAQPQGRGAEFKKEAKEKIEALRKAYINDKLDLTESEASSFWPIYREFKQKEKEIMKNARPSKENRKPLKDMTEAEAEAFINKEIQVEEQKLALKKEYIAKLKNAIPMKKLVRLRRAEKSFRTEVLKRMKNKRDQIRERRNDGEHRDED